MKQDFITYKTYLLPFQAVRPATSLSYLFSTCTLYKLDIVKSQGCT